MKLTITLLLILLSFDSSAQKIRYTDSRNRWVSKGTQFEFACTFTRIRTLGNDTAVFGHSYKPIISTGSSEFDGPRSCLGGPPWPMPDMYIREDTTTNLVYYFIASDTTEHILFDYNLNIGDTFNLIQSGMTVIQFTVIQMDSTLINGIYHKIWGIGFVDAIYTLVEGVGVLQEYYPPFSGFEHSEMLYCFEQDSTYTPVTSPFWNDQFTGSLPPPYSSDSLCPTVSITGVQLPHNSVAIAPNPANENIRLTLKGHSNAPVTVSVFDLMGRAIYLEKPDPATNELNINSGSWPGGLYVVLVQDDKQFLLRKKVLISH